MRTEIGPHGARRVNARTGGAARAARVVGRVGVHDDQLVDQPALSTSSERMPATMSAMVAASFFAGTTTETVVDPFAASSRSSGQSVQLLVARSNQAAAESCTHPR